MSSLLAAMAATAALAAAAQPAPSMGDTRYPVASVRRIVVGHNAQGRSIVLYDGAASTRGPGSRSIRLWADPAYPASNDGDFDQGQHDAGFTLSGSAYRMVDMSPGYASAMHRTSTLDYGIVVKGQVKLRLDDGRSVSAKAGDVIIMRGAMHAWSNVTKKPALVAFVLIKADPVSVAGQTLEPVLDGHR